MKSLLAVVVLLVTCSSAWAQCCAHCGCSSNCEKICRVVCEVKKVPKVTFGCECEDFCVPGPSTRRTVCDDCGHTKHVYTPGCGKVRTRTKLVKHEIFEEKVSYKWVVETLCGSCARRCAAADPTPTALAPQSLATSLPATAVAATAQAASFQLADGPAASPRAAPQGETFREAAPQFDLLRIFRPPTAEK